MRWYALIRRIVDHNCDSAYNNPLNFATRFLRGKGLSDYRLCPFSTDDPLELAVAVQPGFDFRRVRMHCLGHDTAENRYCT